MKRLVVATILLLAAALTAPVALATPPFHTQSWDEPTPSAGSATITSEKPDYHPEETVTLTGTGWKPGELVTIVMVVNPLTHRAVTLTALADADGNFTNSSYIVQMLDRNVTFSVTATGDEGSTAQTTFRDSDTFDVAITGNGTVTDNQGPTIDCIETNGVETGTCTTSYGGGTGTVTETATPASGFVFTSWTNSGTVNCLPVTSATCSFVTQTGSGHTVTLVALFTAAPSATKTFNPTSMPVGAANTSQLTITITNSNAATMAGVAFTDNFPSGVQVASTAGLSNTCGGTITGGAAGNTSVNLSAGSIAANSSCAVKVNVTATTSGSKVNTTSTFTSTADGTGGAATATLAVEIPPTITKAFAPTGVPINTNSVLTLTITNPSANTVALTGLGVTDTFPANLVVASTPGATNTCGGTFAPTANATSITLSGGTVGVNTTCAVSVNVTSATAATYNNTTGNVSSTNGGTGTTSNTATLTVTTPPTITKSFTPPSIASGGTSTLTLTITNPSATQTQTGVAVSDTLPAGMTASGFATTCTGGSTATSTSAKVALTGGSLNTSSSCTVTATVTESTAGSAVNTTGTVSSTNGGTGGTATATLTVVAPPTITKAFGSSATGIPVNTGTSTMTITITNPAANTVALTGVTVSDTFPGGMTVSTALTTTCSGGLTGGGVGTNTFSLNSSTINTGSSCTITGSVKDTTAGVATNTTGAVTSTNGGGTNTATATLPVNTPPTVSKTFAPTSVATGASSQLTITITNPDTVTLTGVTISDTFPAGLVVQTPPGSSTSGCFTGTLTANAGAGSISLSSSSVAVGTPCIIQVNVTSATVGTYNNTTAAPTSTNGGTGNPSNTATLTVAAPPTITKSFTPPSIASGGTSTLKLTITNPATNSGAMNGIAVSDTFPGSMVVTATPTVNNTCGGAFTANANANNISLTGGSIASAGGTCLVSVTVTSTTGGNNSNTTGTVSSTNDGTGGTANAVLNVVLPPTITKAFGSSATGIPVNTGTSTMTITITNPAANTVALTGVTVSDTFPGGMTVSTALTTTCSGGLTGGGVGTNTFSLNSSTINTGSSCTITGSVKDTTAGVATNTTGAVTSTNGGGTNTATATLPVNSPPTVTKAFSPTSVPMSVSSQMTITITNPDTVTLTGVTISDTFPGGLVVQTPPGSGTSGCTGGTLTANAGAGSISLSSSSIAVGTPCVIQVNVTSAAVGTYNNTTGAPTSTNGGTGTTSNTATLTVTAAPTITKSFNPASIPVSGTSTLTLTVTNPATNSGAMNGIAVSDTFPGGMTVASTPALNNTCGGSVAGATTGSGTISLTNGTIATPGTSCTVSVNVTSTTAGSRNNTTGAVSSTNDGTGGTASATLSVFGAATKLVYTQQPTNTAAGSTITPAITVTVEDANSLVVTNSSASIAIAIGTNPGGGTLSGTTPVNAVNGVATFSNLSINRTGTGYTLIATSSGLTSAASTTFNITVGTATQLVFTTEPSTPDTGGTAFTTQPRVTVEDADGNAVPTAGTPVTLAITSGTGTAGATLTCTANTVNTAATGIATFAGCSINLAGTGYTLTATSGSLTAGISTAITVNVGGATKLVFGVQPSNTQFSTAINPPVTVLVEDAGGNIVNSSASITMTIGTNPSGGTLSGTLTVPAASGTATFSNLLINKPGVGYTLHAASGALTAATSNTFNILAGTPTKLVFGVQPSNTMAGAAITPAITVQVEDAGGNVELSGNGSNASVSIVIGSNPSVGVLSGTTTVTAVAGVATFTGLSISAQGNGYTLVANSSGLASATSNLFNITAPQVTYIQPFNSGHGWTYTQTSCSVGLIGSCANSASATGANCASSPCVDADVFAGLQTGASQTGYFNSPIGSYTWASLGVPANSTVVSVQGGWFDEAVGTIGSCATGTTAGIQIFDVTNSVEITSSDVAPLVQVGGDTSITMHNLGAAVNVLNGFQATSTGITLRFNLNQDSATTLGLCTLYGDTFELLIDYTPGSPANGRRGQVVIGWNRQPDGTMGEAWAYNVELTGDNASRLKPSDLKLVPNGRSGFVLDPSALEGNGRRVTKQATE